MATFSDLCGENHQKELENGGLNLTLQNFNKHVSSTFLTKNDDKVLEEYLNTGFYLPRIRDNLECKEEQLRICLPPQVCLSTISDPNLRKFVVKENYTSTYMKMSEDVRKVEKLKIVSPFADFSPVVRLAVPTYDIVSPEWRKESLKWDDHQFKSCIDLDRQLFNKWYKKRHCEKKIK